MYNYLKKRIFNILEVANSHDFVSKFFDIFIMVLISLNVFAVIIGTVKSIHYKYYYFLRTFEVISVIIFSLEYVLRIWTCTFKEKYKRPFWGRLKYVLSALAIIDLIAILPFYLPMLLIIDLRFIRAIRLLRLFRLLKLGRYSKSMKLLTSALVNKKEELFVTTFVIFILLIISSSLMYFVESSAQPDNFSSIPAAMWWGVATLTTVGYGDIYPVTMFGKLLGAFIAILGIGVFALPAGILASSLIEVINEKKDEKIICPYCDKEINNK